METTITRFLPLPAMNGEGYMYRHESRGTLDGVPLPTMLFTEPSYNCSALHDALNAAHFALERALETAPTGAVYVLKDIEERGERWDCRFAQEAKTRSWVKIEKDTWRILNA